MSRICQRDLLEDNFQQSYLVILEETVLSVLKGRIRITQMARGIPPTTGVLLARQACVRILALRGITLFKITR